MEKSMKLFIAGLMLSSVSVAQVTDSKQQYGRGIYSWCRSYIGCTRTSH